MRNLVWLIVVWLVSGCTIKAPSQNWPAVISSFNNLTSDEQTQLLGYVADMNKMSGTVLIKQDSNPNGYPISISMVDAPASNPNRAGYTIKDDAICTVQFSNFLTQSSKEPYFEAVFMHEMGHCAGLVHVTTVGAIMYPTTAQYSTYTPAEFLTFFQNFELSSTGTASTTQTTINQP